MHCPLRSSLLIMILLASGCELENPHGLTLNNNEAALAQRVSYTQTVVAVDEVDSQGQTLAPSLRKPADEATLTLVAEVASPVVDGETLQATEVRILGNKAYVSYNVQGETFLGAIEIFDITNTDSPTLISSLILDDTDINAVAVHNNDVYLAAASDDGLGETPARLLRIEALNGKLSDEIESITLPSYAATDVDVLGDKVYVTSGADGGYVTILERDTLELSTSYAVEDARGVDVYANELAVVAGTPARMFVLDDSGTLSTEYAYEGATIEHSKSTIEVKSGTAVMALGDGGTQLVCLDDGVLLAQLDPPVVDGLDASVTVSNSATAYQRALFIANGEAGVYLALASASFTSSRCQVSDLVMAGKLRLNDLESANHVLYRGSHLFVANGTGGLKIIKVALTNGGQDSDDN